MSPISPTSPRELVKEIGKMDPKKSPGYDLITQSVLKELPKKCLIFITILFNAILRLNHFPDLWKVSQIIMVHKPGKPASDVTSYRPISLTPVLSKLWERIFLTRLQSCLDTADIVPHHQFGFRKNHSTIEQMHRVYNTIRSGLENKEYCSAAFLDVQQAFDRVWHKGLLCKIKKLLPHSIYPIAESYLSDRWFQVKQGTARSRLHKCLAGVPQGSVLGPVLYNIFTCDLPQISSMVSIATFADDTAFLSCDKDPTAASRQLQNQLNETHIWLRKWRIRVSAPKSNHITFTLRKGTCPPVKLGNIELPQSSCVKYLGFHVDQRLTWRNHINKKRDEINHRFRNLLWLLGRQSALSLTNKMLVYNSVLKPIWTYGIQMWSTASRSNVERIQRAQNNILRVISGAPWYTRNNEVHSYLEVPTIQEEVERYKTNYKNRLALHPNPLTKELLQPSKTRRLKRAVVLS